MPTAHGGIRQRKLLQVKSFGIASSWHIASIGRMVVLYALARNTEMTGVLPSFHITISTQVLALARGENSVGNLHLFLPAFILKLYMNFFSKSPGQN